MSFVVHIKCSSCFKPLLNKGLRFLGFVPCQFLFGFCRISRCSTKYIFAVVVLNRVLHILTISERGKCWTLLLIWMLKCSSLIGSPAQKVLRWPGEVQGLFF